MKKIVNLLSFISAFITSVILICTFLTTYQFYYVDQVFNSYLPLQIGLSITMVILSIRFILTENGAKRILYSGLSLTIAMLVIYFMSSLIR